MEKGGGCMLRIFYWRATKNTFVNFIFGVLIQQSNEKKKCTGNTAQYKADDG